MRASNCLKSYLVRAGCVLVRRVRDRSSFWFTTNGSLGLEPNYIISFNYCQGISKNFFLNISLAFQVKKPISSFGLKTSSGFLSKSNDFPRKIVPESAIRAMQGCA